jgi:excinuclease UvrABC helicase subunit UvrB
MLENLEFIQFERIIYLIGHDFFLQEIRHTVQSEEKVHKTVLTSDTSNNFGGFQSHYSIRMFYIAQESAVLTITVLLQ